ncbi:hypothetical protein MNEG_15890, partial [Monoraphidium neglectum]
LAGAAGATTQRQVVRSPIAVRQQQPQQQPQQQQQQRQRRQQPQRQPGAQPLAGPPQSLNGTHGLNGTGHGLNGRKPRGQRLTDSDAAH